MSIVIPTRKRGRQTEESQRLYEQQLWAFANAIKQINSSLNFSVSARGWCYILEEHGLTKGDFDKAQKIMVECRKSGLLPINICAEDKARSTEGVEGYIDSNSPEEEAQYIVDNIWTKVEYYNPVSFWDDQDYYVEVLVEKIDLKSLFEPICRKYSIPITNARGWTDLNSRAAIMRRFQEHGDAGRECVLLYCGDHDPGGLNISDSIMSNMEDLSEAVGWDPYGLEIERFGLNYDFIEEQDLTWIDNLETSSGGRLDDPRHKDHYKSYVQTYLAQFGARKVEANALVVRPEAGRKLCEDAICEYITRESVEKYRKFIHEERKKVTEALPDVLKDYVEGME